MSSSIEQIKKPILKELENFETQFRQSMKTKVPLLDTIMTYIVKRKGKQIRPIFVLYSAALFGEINDKTLRGASLVELLHTATLVHDDVVDESYKRRGFFSIYALWKNKIAILVGDFLLSKGLLLSVQNKDFDFLEMLSVAVQEMSEGELLQLERAKFMNATEEVYFEIIRKKTASLIASCCQIGAASTQPDVEIQEKMRKFGELIGLAFQIRDDLFDFGDGDAGKPQGNDIQEKKMTLPLIHALNCADKSKRNYIINIIKNENTDPKKIQEVTEFVINSPGIEYTRQKMYDYRNEAIFAYGRYDSQYFNRYCLE
jgi:octaprenyl-diphosphate synthase